MDVTSVGIYDISYTVASAFIFQFYDHSIFTLCQDANSYFHDKTDNFPLHFTGSAKHLYLYF